MSGQPKIPTCVLELEKFWFLNGFLPLTALVPPRPSEATVAAAVSESPASDTSDDSDAQAEQLLYGGRRKKPRTQTSQATWQQMVVRTIQPDPQLHDHLELMIQDMTQHEEEFVDPLHRPWRPRELIMLIQNFTKVRSRADMNHCDHCGQMNPSEYTQCLRCRTDLPKDELEKAIEGGNVEGAMELEGFRLLPSPCIKYFLLCEAEASETWCADMAQILRPLYMLFTSSRFLAAEMVTGTTDHAMQAAMDLNNLNRHLNLSLAKGRQVVETLQKHAVAGDVAAIKASWAVVADAALEAQQNLCLMIDAWEEFEGVRLDQWWEPDEIRAQTPVVAD